MEIQSFKLSNVGHFGDLDIEFAPTRTHSSNITVLVGNNGTGKTTVLKSVNTCLTWLIARIRSDKGKGRQLADEEIRNDAPAAVVSIGLADRSHPRAAVCNDDDENHLFVWGSARTRGEPAVSDRGFLRDVRELADHYRTRLTADASASLPLIAYYPAERCVNDISLKPSGRQAFDQLDAYDSSFSDGADFRGFFAWFREREDSENEDGLSASALAAISERFGTDSDVWKELATIKASARGHNKGLSARQPVDCCSLGYRGIHAGVYESARAAPTAPVYDHRPAGHIAGCEPALPRRKIDDRAGRRYRPTSGTA